jgi:hypothetical protein
LQPEVIRLLASLSLGTHVGNDGAGQPLAISCRVN